MNHTDKPIIKTMRCPNINVYVGTPIFDCEVLIAEAIGSLS